MCPLPSRPHPLPLGSTGTEQRSLAFPWSDRNLEGPSNGLGRFPGSRHAGEEDHRDRRRLLVSLLKTGDLVVMGIALALALALSADSWMPADLQAFFALRVKVSNLLVLTAFAMGWLAVLRSRGLYRSRRIGAALREWLDIASAVFFFTLVLAASAVVLDFEAISGRALVVFFVVAAGGMMAMRTTLRFALEEARRNGRNLRNVIVVGCGPRAQRLGAELRQRGELGYLLLGYVDDLPAPPSPVHSGQEKLLGGLAEMEKVLDEHAVDEVLIALPVKSYYEEIAKIVSLAEDRGITVRMPADFFRLQIARAAVDYLDCIPIISLRTPQPTLASQVAKRALDFIGASLGLLLLSPLFLVVSLLIKLTSPGPILFRQVRIGRGRREFGMLKFRTMMADAELRQETLKAQNEVNGAAFKIKNDPRVTPLGRWLRKFSIDELPQLWNVLKGDMSLVGPRPLPPRDVEAFQERWQSRRFSVKPGLTCLWQANGRHEIGFDEWMELDLQYIDQWSFGLDLEILLKTVPAVLRGTGSS